MEWIPYNRLFVKNHIGKGGFGTVNLASWLDGPIISWNNNDQKWNRNACYSVALKILNDSNKTFDLLKEVKTYTQINDNTFFIQCLGLSQDPKGNYIMVMELAPFGSLCTYLNNIITWNRGLKVLLDISKGLLSLHNSSLTHRDFHPGNLLFKSERNLLITDLGLCKPANENSQSDNIYGVMPYVAPEVLKGKPYTQKADIYSFGMIMYFVATGEQPFSNCAHDQGLASRICNGIRPEIDEFVVPKCYTDLMEKCWNSNSNERPDIAEIKELMYSFIYSKEDQFKKVEDYRKKRLLSIKNNKLTTHPQAIYASQLLNPYTEKLSINDYSESIKMDFTNSSINNENQPKE